MNLRGLVISIGLVVLAGAQARSQVTLPKMLASHMVVQREMPVHVWGMARPNEQVTVHTTQAADYMSLLAEVCA